MSLQKSKIIFSNNKLSIVCFPLGYVFGCSIEIINFKKNLLKSIKSSFPVSISSSYGEFVDCVEFLSKEYSPLKTCLVNLKGYNSHEIEKYIFASKCKIYGYINGDLNEIDNVFRNIDFSSVQGIHIFNVGDIGDYKTLSIHLVLPQIKNRKIDIFLSINEWCRLNEIEMSYDLLIKIIKEYNFSDIGELIKIYKKSISNNHFNFSNSIDISYKEYMKEKEREYLKLKINENNGNIQKTSKQIGISRNTLKKKVEIYGI